MIAFLDTSALVKLVSAEPETPALRTHVAAAALEVAVSGLSHVELRRVALRVDEVALGACEQLLANCSTVALTPRLFEQAGTLRPAGLGSLDAIQLASALTLAEDLDAFVAYDTRLLSGAVEKGLHTISPR